MARKNVLTQGMKRQALALYKDGRVNEAAPLLQQVCAKDRRDVEAWALLGTIHASQEDYAEAERCFGHVVALQPKAVDAHYNLARSLELQGKYEAAEAGYRRALKLDSARQPDTWNNLGNVYRQLERYEEALECYAQALSADPSHARALNNRGVALHALSRAEEAVAEYDAALAVDPDYIEVHWNKALAMLALGAFEPGWREFEWGFAVGQRSNAYAPYPLWDGGPLAGRGLLVQCEQGVGDEVMFAACLPDVMGDAGRCVVECDPRLESLFRRSFPEAVVIGHLKDDQQAWLSRVSGVDMKISAGSLPRYYRTGEDKFPRHGGYLAPDPALTGQWRERLNRVGAGLKIGISWRGGSNALVKRRRSLPLEAWRQVLKLPDTVFINLQYDVSTRELEQVQRDMQVTIHHWEDADALTDLESFTALMSGLDLIVSVDNSTVHFAGALGRPVLALLPHAAEWRWMLDREDSPWYPSVKLLRQPAPGEWGAVIDRVVSEIEKIQG